MTPNAIAKASACYVCTDQLGLLRQIVYLLVEISQGSLGGTARITETGAIRITQNGSIRIINPP